MIDTHLPTPPPAPSRDDEASSAGSEAIAIPLVEESTTVEKRAVDAGGYRIRKTVHHLDETIDELLHDHRVQIERKPVGRQLCGQEVPEPRFEGDVLIIPVLEEVLVTEKRLVLVEEVHVVRVRGTHRDEQRVTLRKEEISIERLDPEPRSDAEPT